MSQESRHHLASPLLRVGQGCTQGVGQAVFSSAGCVVEESTFRLSQVVSRIHLLVSVELKTFMDWTLEANLSSRSHLQFLEAASSSRPHGIPLYRCLFHQAERERWLECVC